MSEKNQQLNQGLYKYATLYAFANISDLESFKYSLKRVCNDNKILGTIHAYPTYADANKLTAGIWRKNHAPDWVFGLLQRFHRWRRNA